MLLRNYAILLVCLSLFSACASSGERAVDDEEANYQGAVIDDGSVAQEKLGEQYGPALPTPEQDADAAAAGPAAPPPAAPPAAAAPKLCLVLGPGMAKALAQASVLEAIRKAGLPVHCVVGSEMGALVGALYSQSGGNVNELQWQLFKLNGETYFNFPLLSLRTPKSSGNRLHEYLTKLFGARKIEELPIRFATVASDLDRDASVTFDRGSVADALSATLAMPGVFEPWRVGGASLYSGAVSSPAPLELARQLGGNFLVLIDVIGDAAGSGDARFQKAFSPVRNLLRLQRKDASFVIEVPAAAVAYDDFTRQGEIQAAGTRAAEAAVPELKAAWEKFASTPR